MSAFSERTISALDRDRLYTPRRQPAVPLLDASSEERAMDVAVHEAQNDPAEIVGRVAAARRDRLLRAYRRRLRPEELEDCFSQATLELVVRSRRAPFNSAEHVKNALEQKFASRVNDRRRALSGRSGIEAALANAVSVSDADWAHVLEDRAAGVERHVHAHAELRRLREVIGELSPDQRLVLHSQVNLGLEANEFCARYGWSPDKFRKVAQRARQKLRTLVAEYHRGERCERLEPDLVALAVRVGTEEQLRRARMHVDNCPSCARYVATVDRASRSTASLSWPPLVAAGQAAWRGWLHGVRRLVHAVRPTGATGATTGAAGVTGGSALGLVSAKAGVLALCVAGAAGTYALCEREPLLAAPAHVRIARPPVHRVELRQEFPIRTAPGLQPARVRKLSQVAQIEREFGARRRIATITSDRGSNQQPAAPQRLSSQSDAVVAGETAEFGFER